LKKQSYKVSNTAMPDGGGNCIGVFQVNEEVVGRYSVRYSRLGSVRGMKGGLRSFLALRNRQKVTGGDIQLQFLFLSYIFRP
jgi:hypothetical protein